MSQHRDPRLGAGEPRQRLAQSMADAAIGDAAAGLVPPHMVAGHILDRLGHHHEREVAALAAQLVDMRRHRFERVRDLGNEDHVGAAGNA